MWPMKSKLLHWQRLAICSICDQRLPISQLNPEDIVPLTPNHFLHGQLGGQFAPETVDITEFSPRKSW